MCRETKVQILSTITILAWIETIYVLLWQGGLSPDFPCCYGQFASRIQSLGRSVWATDNIRQNLTAKQSGRSSIEADQILLDSRQHNHSQLTYGEIDVIPGNGATSTRIPLSGTVPPYIQDIIFMFEASITRRAGPQLSSVIQVIEQFRYGLGRRHGNFVINAAVSCGCRTELRGSLT
jgi:hypothetical protein